MASQNNDVKYIQSELEGAGGLEDPPSSKLQTKIPTGEAVKHIEDAIKQDGPKPGDDDPLKAFGAAGNDISASLQAYKNSFPLKSLPKAAESSVFQSLMKQQQQARGTSRGIGEGLEDGLPKTLKDISEGIDDLHPENVMRNSKQLGGDEDPAAGQLISKVASAEPESFMKEAASQPDKDAGDLTADSKGGVGEDTFKELQDADISGGPDPYLNDQKDNGQNADSGNSMFAGAGDLQQAGKPPKFSDDAPYGDMMSTDDGIRNFAPRAPPQDTFGDMYDKDDMDNPPQTPESYYNMGNSDDQFRSRQSIPRNVLWGATNRESDDDDNLSTQIFKRNIIMRPKKDNYVSPFKGKRSFEFDP